MTRHIYDALIVGSGYGGLGAAAQLKRHGIDDFVVLEKADRVGGVWRDNTYPGAACDTQSVIYCYSYFLHLKVSRMYAGQGELLGYLESLADEFGLRDKIRFGSHVTAARWDADIWHIIAADGSEYSARVFIPAWGQLSTPFTPPFPGRDEFIGASFHSAEWDDVDLAGKRVASIGAAASAVQYVPEVARGAAHLTVFQRSANYILPRNQIVFSEAESRRFQDDPSAFIEVRQGIHDQREAGFARTRHDSTSQHEAVQEARAHLEAQVADPELRRKLTPDYEFGCKRILRSDDYYPALTRENVAVATAPIERITPTGILTADGVHHELDVIIFGTGFKSQAFQGDLVITGRNGVTLDERWGNSPEAYLGITVDGFPNMCIVYGPNTNLNHNSVVTVLEAQHEYIAKVVEHVRDREATALDVKADVLRAFNDMVQHELEQSAYSSECSSWYKNADGKVINNWCGTVDDYRNLTRDLNLADYEPVR